MNTTFFRFTTQTARTARLQAGLEQLDSRLMMTAAPAYDAAAATRVEPVVSAVVDTDDSLAEGLQLDLDVIDHRVMPGSTGGSHDNPNPDDPDGDWGPWGPWVHEALQQLTERIAERFADRIQIEPGQRDGFSFDARGLINTVEGLYVPLAHEVLQTLRAEGPTPTPWSADDLSRLFYRQMVSQFDASPDSCVDWRGIVLQTAGRGGGDSGYPDPDDPDGDWGPIGPIVRTALEQLAARFGSQLAHGITGPGTDGHLGPELVTPLVQTVDDLSAMVAINVIKPGCDFGEFFGGGVIPVLNDTSLQETIEQQLELWLRDPDPLVSIDWGAILPEFAVPERPIVGDVNHDGLFDSSDLVQLFQAGEYEDRVVGNSVFEEGDFNGDGDFDSSDLIMAFQQGHYETARVVADVFGNLDTVDDLIALRR